MRAFLFVAALALSVPVVALAQDPASAHEGEVIHVYGSPPRPHATVLIPRARVHFDRAEPAHHAVDRIVDSVSHAPF